MSTTARSPYVVVADPSCGFMAGNGRHVESAHHSLAAAKRKAHDRSDGTSFITFYYKRLWIWSIVDERSGERVYYVDPYGTGREANGAIALKNSRSAGRGRHESGG